MATNLRLISNAAQGDAHKLTARGAADGHGQRSLAHAGRTDQTENRPARILDQLANGEIFENALFDLLQTVMIFL